LFSIIREITLNSVNLQYKSVKIIISKFRRGFKKKKKIFVGERLKYAKKGLQKNFEPKLQKMAKNGQNWQFLLIIALNGLNWPKMANIGHKWQKIVKIPLKARPKAEPWFTARPFVHAKRGER